jgi:hypothetical protein
MDKGQFISIDEAQRSTLGDLIARYLVEITPTMKGATEDTIRLKAIMRRSIASWSMANLSAARVAGFRDERLKEVSAGTVIRELAYLSSIINHARREWGINVPNPVQMVRKPPSPQSRGRVLADEEVSKLLQALEPTGRRSHWTKPAVQLALAANVDFALPLVLVAHALEHHAPRLAVRVLAIGQELVEADVAAVVSVPQCKLLVVVVQRTRDRKPCRVRRGRGGRKAGMEDTTRVAETLDSETTAVAVDSGVDSQD